MSKFKQILSDTSGKMKESLVTVKVGYENMKDSFEEGSESMLLSLKKLADMSSLSKDKLALFANKIIGLGPVLETVGFAMDGVNIEVTLPPKITISLSKIRDVNEEEILRVKEENQSNEILILIINTILSISQFQSKLSLANYELGGIDILISVPPGVSLKLKKKAVD